MKRWFSYGVGCNVGYGVGTGVGNGVGYGVGPSTGTASGTILAFDIRKLGGTPSLMQALIAQTAAHSPFGINCVQIQPMSSKVITEIRRAAEMNATKNVEVKTSANIPNRDRAAPVGTKVKPPAAIFSPLASENSTKAKSSTNVSLGAQVNLEKSETIPNHASDGVASASAGAGKDKAIVADVLDHVRSPRQPSGVEVGSENHRIELTRSRTRSEAESKIIEDHAKNLPQVSSTASEVAEFKAVMESAMNDLRKDVHEDIQSMHIELLRQFRLQVDDIREILDGYTTKFGELVKENKELRRENLLLKNIF